MCRSVTSYYLDCGHAQYQPISCPRALLYEADVTTDYCTKDRNYTSWSDSSCDTCTLLRGLEVLCLRNADDPLVWMNQIYRASIDLEPEPRDQAIEDTLNIAVAVDERHKTPQKRAPSQDEAGQKVDKKPPSVAWKVPCDIFDQEKKPCVGRGTPGRQATRGHFQRRQAH